MAINFLVSTWATIGAVLVTWAVVWTLDCLIVALLNTVTIVGSASKDALSVLAVAVVETLLSLLTVILSTVVWSRIVSWTEV